MVFLRRLLNIWRRMVYRIQAKKRMNAGVYRSSAASRRVCANCLRNLDPGESVVRCKAHRLPVHGGDTCRKYVQRVEE